MQASEKDDMGKESTSSMHLRYKKLGEIVFWCSKKDTSRVSQKDSMHSKDEKLGGSLCKVSY